jgi:transglutaminase-like putative cysteine protease
MPRTYKFLTFVLAFTGCLSLLMTGETMVLMSLTVIGIFPGYYRFLKGKPQAPKWAIGGLSVLTLLIFFVDSFAISNDYFLAVAHLTLAFQAIKSFDLKEPWDHLQVYFMSLLQLIIASELTHSIAFGVIFVLFLVALVSAIVIAHFIKEGTTSKVNIRKPVALISVLAVVVTVTFFVSVPRISGGIWGKGHVKTIRTVGFSGRVDFGSFSNLKLDPTVVMRVEVSGNSKGPYYWRGITLDYFDGVSWSDTFDSRERVSKEDGRFQLQPFERDRAVAQRIFLEPMDTDLIFGLSRIAAIETEARGLFADRSGSLFIPAKRGKQFRYTAYSIADRQTAIGDMDKYLQLPADTRRISALARETAGREEGDLAKAIKIESFLRNNYTYSLSVPTPPPGMSAIEDFLFNSKRGYCEHYATAMVLMLRTLGIPARIVTGFSGGELNTYGGYIIVRESNAHSWVEAAIDDEWMRFDPTPPVSVERPSSLVLFVDALKMNWDRYVVAFNISDQKEIVRVFSLPFRLPQMPEFRPGIASFVIFLSISAILAAIVILLTRLRGRRYDFLTAQYVKVRNSVRRRGARVSVSSTAAEVAEEAVRLGMNGKIREFVATYEGHRFGGREMSGEDRVKYKRLMKEIRREIGS